jgi:hypothetical protein
LQEKLKTVKPDAEFRLEWVRGILEHCMAQKRGDLKFSKPEKLPASAKENKGKPDADEAREASSARMLRRRRWSIKRFKKLRTLLTWQQLMK